METRFMLETPNKISATMKITMTLEYWEKLRDQLHEIKLSHSIYPTRDLITRIDDLFCQARKVYYPTIEEKEE